MKAGPLALARPELVSLPAPPPERATLPVALDANEVPWRPAGDRTRGGLNRYPPVRAGELAARLAGLYGTAAERVLVTRGSDEAIDLLVRAFCRPGVDAVVVLPPTFGMYALSARIQGARVVTVPRSRADGFAIPLEAVARELDGTAKLLFVPSPDNPTGRRLEPATLEALAAVSAGRALLVVDEAYGEFAGGSGAVGRLDDWPHLVVLRTLSKAHALAGARLGAALARPEIVDLLARILPPYAVTRPSLEAASAQLGERALAATARRLGALVRERERLSSSLASSPAVREVFPSAANFLLVAFHDVLRAAAALAAAGIAARSYDEPAIADCLRITVAGPAESGALLAALAPLEAR